MPDHDFTSPRLFVEADLGEGAVIEAGSAQANYLRNVLRKGAGDAVLLFNGRDGEWRADLALPSRKRLELLPRHKVRAQTPPGRVAYAFAPLKQARLDYMVQKAVEMGAGILQPVLTQHVQAPRIQLDRMRANAIEAAEQCGILALPAIRPAIRLEGLLAGLDDGARLVFCDEREAAGSPLRGLGERGDGEIVVLIGPEGGFSQGERALVRAHPAALPISLGPRILRADTAAVAALAVVQATIGDWAGG